MELVWEVTAASGLLNEYSYGDDAHQKEAVSCVAASSGTVYQKTHLMSYLLRNY